MTFLWSFATSSYSSRCLRMSKLRDSTLRWAFSIERVTQRCSIASPPGIFNRSMIRATRVSSPPPLRGRGVIHRLVAPGFGFAAEQVVGAGARHVGGDGDHLGP